MQYKVLFTGLGSIGQKHLKNLKSLGEFYVDALRTKNEPAEGVENVYTSFDDIPDDYDIIFVTNPTNLHYETVNRLHSKTKNMFIEKPIFDFSRNCEFSKGVNYVACPLRYSNVVQELKKYVEENKVYAFRAICSSYLPAWRKTGDYRQCYSAKADKGGGVELDLIHEIDYLKWIFGKFDSIKRLSGKKSELEITSNDIAIYGFENKNVIGSLHLDYFGRDTKREIEVFSDKETKVFDIVKTSNNIYIEELKYFLKAVETGNKDCYNTPEEANESLEAALK